MAVYTEVSDTELESFLVQYDIGALLSFKGIAEGVENSNYLLHTERGSFILTLYEKRVAAADLPYFLGFMEHLAARGVACPTPVKARDGSALRRLKGKPAAIVTFLEGVWVRRPKAQHCAGLGRALAEMHRAGADYASTRANALGPKGWRKLVSACGRRADELRAGLSDELAKEMEALDAVWPKDLPTGHIHADLFPDNVFFVRDKLSGLIDFYFACSDFLAYDIAVCLNSWCFEADGQFNITNARALTNAYAQARPLTARELETLPLLARGAAFRFLLTRLYDWLTPQEGALVKPKDPLEFLQKLRFHRNVEGPSAYGLG
jgi:homoserine kinase type II